jgi:hypothetical protein
MIARKPNAVVAGRLFQLGNSDVGEREKTLLGRTVIALHKEKSVPHELQTPPKPGKVELEYSNCSRGSAS